MITRLDHPDAGEANAAALEDLAEGAEGLQVVFAGAAGAYGYGLARFDAATLHRVFEGVRFENGLKLELDLGPDGLEQAESVAALFGRLGADARDIDSLSASIRSACGCVPARPPCPGPRKRN